MLAGRKLLLADDSVTIQKVIELTFADEGVRVVAVGNGQDAIDRLEEVAPDIVLADVFMPSKSGYEVCEYVKQSEKHKHIPVMLLVGSFEPFDEAEARRVGADDILTKPFQSIRRLIDRVGALVMNPPTAKEVATMELPKADEKVYEDVRLNTEEIEVMTADTQQFPDEMQETLEFPQSESTGETAHEEKMETRNVEVDQEMRADSSDVLLDLGEIEHADVMDSDEFVLDLDDTIGGDAEPVPMRAFVEPQVTESSVGGLGHAMSYQPEVQAASFAPVEAVAEVAYEDQVHEVTSEPVRVIDEGPAVAVESAPQPVAEVPVAVVANPGELSQQMIDAIARRVVEMMSDKVVREIAWEVVPDLSELLIKKQLEDQEAK